MGVLIIVGVIIWRRKNSRPGNLDVVLEMMERAPPPPVNQSPVNSSVSIVVEDQSPDDEKSRVSIVVSGGVTSVKYSQNEDSSKMAAKILDNLKTGCSTITEHSPVII